MIFNSQKALKKTKLKKNQIVIVDDGCPQKSGTYAKKLSKKKNIKIIFHKYNKGYGLQLELVSKIVPRIGFFKLMATQNMMFLTYLNS